MDAPLRVRRALAVWLVIAAAETLHGTLREVVLAPLVGAFAARQIAVFTGSLIVFAIAVAFAQWIGGRRPVLLAVGLLWVGLTVAFEIGLGRALGYSWARLASDYDLRAGGLMSVGLLVMLLAPLAAARVRRATPGRGGDDGSSHLPVPVRIEG